MEIFSHPDFDAHECIFFVSEKQAGLKAIIAIHSTRLGPALGGLRMRACTPEEALKDVLRLSRGMSFKAAMAKLPLGGGKAIIIGNPETQKTEALLRAFARALFRLGGNYITAEDSGTSVADMEIIADEIDRLAQGTSFKSHQFVVGREKTGSGSGDPSEYTARGVYESIKAAVRFQFKHDNLRSLCFGVQGVGGHVGTHLARLLLEEGVTVIGTEEDLERNTTARERFSGFGGRFTMLPDINEIYGNAEMDIFCPCALGGTLNDQTIRRLECSMVVGAANNQLAHEVLDAHLLHQRHITYVPDFVANAGGLIGVAEELEAHKENRAFDEARVTEQIQQIGVSVTEVLTRSGEYTPPSFVACQIVRERISRGTFD